MKRKGDVKALRLDLALENYLDETEALMMKLEQV